MNDRVGNDVKTDNSVFIPGLLVNLPSGILSV